MVSHLHINCNVISVYLLSVHQRARSIAPTFYFFWFLTLCGLFGLRKKNSCILFHWTIQSAHEYDLKDPKFHSKTEFGELWLISIVVVCVCARTNACLYFFLVTKKTCFQCSSCRSNRFRLISMFISAHRSILCITFTSVDRLWHNKIMHKTCQNNNKTRTLRTRQQDYLFFNLGLFKSFSCFKLHYRRKKNWNVKKQINFEYVCVVFIVASFSFLLSPSPPRWCCIVHIQKDHYLMFARRNRITRQVTSNDEPVVIYRCILDDFLFINYDFRCSRSKRLRRKSWNGKKSIKLSYQHIDRNVMCLLLGFYLRWNNTLWDFASFRTLSAFIVTIHSLCALLFDALPFSDVCLCPNKTMDQ